MSVVTPSHGSCAGPCRCSLIGVRAGKERLPAWRRRPQLPTQTVKIAFIDPLSGPFAAVGTNILKQFQFMTDLANAQQLGGQDIKFEIVPFDNKARRRKPDPAQVGRSTRASATSRRATAPASALALSMPSTSTTSATRARRSSS